MLRLCKVSCISFWIVLCRCSLLCGTKFLRICWCGVEPASWTQCIVCILVSHLVIELLSPHFSLTKDKERYLVQYISRYFLLLIGFPCVSFFKTFLMFIRSVKMTSSFCACWQINKTKKLGLFFHRCLSKSSFVMFPRNHWFCWEVSDKWSASTDWVDFG